MHVDLYVETSIRGPRRQNGTFGYILVYITKSGEEATLCDFVNKKDVTPHEIELEAIIKALGRLNKKCDVSVIAGNPYVADMTSNLQKWKGNGWITAKGEDIKNKELWQQLEELLEKHQVTFGGDDTGYQKWLINEVKRKGEQQHV
ncbi:MAG: hypothetical protein IJN92_09420 [Lachnospiraceae bacterium]|nr:hypothetical protein [Lachnospiraceae bacterium]